MKNQWMYYVSIFWIFPLNFQLNFLIRKILQRSGISKKIWLFPSSTLLLYITCYYYLLNTKAILTTVWGHLYLFFLGIKNTFFKSIEFEWFISATSTYLWNMQEVFEIDFDFNQYCLPIQYVLITETY